MSAIAISDVLRPATALAAAALVIALLVSAVPSAQAQSSSTSMESCWAPDQLAFKEGEDRIRRATRSALIEPPNRTPVPSQAVPPDERLAIRRVKLPPGLKLVALTFDLCELPYEIAGYQGGIVDYL